MEIRHDDTGPRGVTLLSAFNEFGDLVVEQTVPVADYYEELHPIIDDDIDFRAQRKIRVVIGKIYDYDGKLDQEFRNEYDARGSYVRSRIAYSDGTVVES